MPASSTFLVAVAFLVSTIATGLIGFRWATGRFGDVKFFAGIFATFFIVSSLCILISWRVACPQPGKWFNQECFHKARIIGKTQ